MPQAAKAAGRRFAWTPPTWSVQSATAVVKSPGVMMVSAAVCLSNRGDEAGVGVQVDEAHRGLPPPGVEPSPAMLARSATKEGYVVNIGSEGTMLIFFAYVVLVLATALLARRKGRSAVLWAVIALFLPIIALVIVLLLPVKTAPAGGRSA